MSTYYIDETGFTGEDLISREQPLFVLSTNNFTSDEAEAIIRATFSGVDARELKHSRLIRNPRHRDRMIELVRAVASDPTRAGTWISHKEFALVTLVVDWWMEPLAHLYGHNLYKDGANLGMANMLFACLEGFWNKAFRRKLLSHFQRMFRSRTRERFAECERLIRKEMGKADANRAEILRYFWPSFQFLGLPHIKGLPDRVLDLALPALVMIGNNWRKRDEGPWEVVHDQSSNMAKQKWYWDTLSSPEIPAAQFHHPGGLQMFPMNVKATRFGNSAEVKQLQICDILAGTTSAFLRSRGVESEDGRYCDGLSEAGIERLILGGMWPTTQITPEELGTKGWDGNVPIEWIAKQFARKNEG